MREKVQGHPGNYGIGFFHVWKRFYVTCWMLIDRFVVFKEWLPQWHLPLWKKRKCSFLSPSVCKPHMMPWAHECAIVEPKRTAYKKVNNTSRRETMCSRGYRLQESIAVSWPVLWRRAVWARWGLFIHLCVCEEIDWGDRTTVKGGWEEELMKSFILLACDLQFL